MHTCRRLLCAGLVCFAWPGLSIAQEVDDRQQPPQQAQTADKPEAAKAPADKPVAPNPEAEPPGGKRIFGVLPNYRTVDDNGVYTPITTSHKMHIAVKDSFDYPLFILGGALAALGQLTNQDPSFGQGIKGYAHRVATGYADQALGNLMTEGIFPMMLHEDPRYHRKVTGSAKSRTWYALSRIFVTYTDSGSTRFNYSEWLGNSAAVAISNAYYPDNRTASDNAIKLVEQCGIDAASQVLKEFWPDVKRKLFHKTQPQTQH